MISESKRILSDICQGRYRITRHAKERMDERGVTSSDIRSCAKTAGSIVQQENKKHLISGFDVSGDKLRVVAVWDSETLIITVMGD